MARSLRNPLQTLFALVLPAFLPVLLLVAPSMARAQEKPLELDIVGGGAPRQHVPGVPQPNPGRPNPPGPAAPGALVEDPARTGAFEMTLSTHCATILSEAFRPWREATASSASSNASQVA